MTHILEPATTARAQCRACGRKIEKGELRFGEKRENAFGEGESTLWFHPACAAYSRPAQFLELLNEQPNETLEYLRVTAQAGVDNERLTRAGKADRAPTGRANCRHCHQPIEKGSWRLGLMFFEEFRFNAGGYIHPRCARDYFGTTVIIDRIQHFSPELSADDLSEIEQAMAAP
jgi:Poly(ADP-ribose) polymerase and DNA-Ligase Zn-finger region